MKIIFGLISLLLAGFILFILLNSQRGNNTDKIVTIYISEDQIFSEPIIKEFEKDTGIHVQAIYDTEESKSTGVMNRLIAEKNNPQADVYWANEPIRAEVLKLKGISTPYFSKNGQEIPKKFKDPEGYWCGFSARARVFIVNNLLRQKPTTIFDYANATFKDKAVIANPLFGTTTSQIAALFTVLGDEKAKQFMRSVKSDNIAISTSNGESADLVASNRYEFSLVDSDDAINRIRQGKPVNIVYPDQKKDEIGIFIVPNVTVLIKNSPHQKEGKILIEYLLSKQTEAKLAQANCAQIPLHKDVKGPKELKPINRLKVMNVNYAKVAKKMVQIQPYIKEWMEF